MAWYYEVDGEEHGPAEMAELDRLLAQGEISEDTMVYPVGEEQGLRFGELLKQLGGSEDAVTCSQCGNDHPASDVIEVEGLAVCAGCKGEFLQRMREGVTPRGTQTVPQDLDIGAVISHSFEIAKRHWYIVLVPIIVTNALGQLSQFLIQGIMVVVNDPAVGMIIFGFLMFIMAIVQWWITLGQMRIALDCVDKDEGNLGDMFTQGRYLLRWLGATLVMGLVVLLGLICFIIPGIILGLRYSQYSYLILDRDMGAMESLSESARITNGIKGELFLTFLVLGMINVAGVLACCVGVLFTAPMTAIGMAVVYRVLSSRLDTV